MTTETGTVMRKLERATTETAWDCPLFLADWRATCKPLLGSQDGLEVVTHLPVGDTQPDASVP